MPLRFGILFASTALLLPSYISIADLTAAEFVGASAVAFFGVFGAGFIGRMSTVVREKAITVRVLGLEGFRVPFDCIRSVRIVPYDARVEFGGWGYRRLEHGVAFLPRGDHAVEITMSDGRRALIGSQRPEELCQALATADRECEL